MSFDIFGNSGRRKGTIRKERGFFGDTSYVTRDNYGRKKSTTRKETDFFGNTSYVTRDQYGRKINLNTHNLQVTI